jgi:methylase of polypeptide subunit release factors
VAKKNIARYKTGRGVNAVRSNLFEKLKAYDLIVSNPPYVTAKSMKKSAAGIPLRALARARGG